MTELKSVLGLATIRKNRGITLEQIANDTKIGVRALEAIERGDFRKLPGGIYDTNYIRQYARAIDFDETPILELYYRDRGEITVPKPTRGFFGGLRAAHTISG
jgi:cytoskeletal protein RodZ